MALKPELVKLISEELDAPAEEITPSANFRDHLGADSFDRIHLFMACEDLFQIEIPDPDAEKIETVGDLQQYIEEAKHARGGTRSAVTSAGISQG
jgi:acyl carrier protein